MSDNMPSIRVLKKGGDSIPFALARIHSSWFLCYAKPVGISAKRAALCINHIGSAKCFPSPSPENGNARFVVGDGLPDMLTEELLPLRDLNGNPAIEMLEERVDGLPVVEVLIPPSELLYGCACCGKWEAIRMPRFMRCSSCRSRYYCSKDCQKKDWSKKSRKALTHKEECKMLKDGREYEVEQIMQLHDNAWWHPGRTMSGRELGDEEFTTDYALYGQKLDIIPATFRSPFQF